MAFYSLIRTFYHGKGTFVRKFSNKFGISLTYSYLCNMWREMAILLTLCICLVTNAQKQYKQTDYDEREDTPSDISCIQQDHRGLLWVATLNGLYRYDGYEWRNYKSHSGDGTRLKHNRVKKLYISHEGNLWCLMDGHAMLFDLQTYRFVDVLANYEQQQKQSLTITKIRTLSNGSTWFMTKSGTLLTISHDHASEVTKVMEDIDDERTNISDDIKGLTWIITPQASYTFDGSTLKKERRSVTSQDIQDTGEEDYPEYVSGSYHITDRKGDVWFIREKQLHRLSFQKNCFQTFPLPQPMTIRSTMKDRHGRLWISEKDHGYLMLYSPQQQLLGYIGSDGRLSQKEQSFGSAVYSMLQDRQGNYWLGTRTDGIFRLKESTGAFHTEHFTTENSTLNAHKINDLKEDRHGRIWIATDTGGLVCIPEPLATEPHFIHGGNGLKSYLPSYCRKCFSLLLTADNHLLIGTLEGLYVADINARDMKNLVFKEHQREAFRKESLGSSEVGCLIEMADHRIFATTQGGGVNEILSENLMGNKLEFRHYNTNNGFFTDLPLTMFGASQNTLWIVSKKRLAELKFAKPQFVCNAFPGQEKSDFTDIKPIQLSDGQWLLGTSDGLVTVHLDELKANSYVPEIVVTDVAIEGEHIIHIPQTTDTITLAPGQRSVSITFAALDYTNPSSVKYAYQIGKNKTWDYINSGGHSITLASLEPDTYYLTLRSTNSDGMWMDNLHTIVIVVKPTFWQTGWARLLIMLIILSIGGIVAYTLLYIRRIKKQQSETLKAYLDLIENNNMAHEKAQAITATSDSKEMAPTVNLSPEDDTFMKRLITYIEANISNPDAAIDDMANATATSHSSLSRKVNRLVGMTPMEFLREARMRKACQLLSETDKTVNEIAYICGFSDPKYFRKCFKQAMDMTPIQYRESD